MHDLEDLKSLDITRVAEWLGLTVTRKKVRCWNPQNHAHGDRTPSVSLHNNRWRCWGCGTSGDVIDLVAQARGISTKEAIKTLRERFEQGPLNPIKSKARSKKTEPVVPEVHRQIYQTLIDLAGRCYSNAGALYLRSRGIDPEWALAFGVRCLSELYIDRVLATLQGDFPEEDLYRAGIINERRKFRFWAHRLLFPFYDGDEIVYLQGRILHREKNQGPRWLNSGSYITVPWNVNGLRKAPAGSAVFICEGIPDALTLICHGMTAVAITGTHAFKDSWFPLFRGKQVMLAMDNDLPGRIAREKLTERFRLAGLEIAGNLPLKEGCDANQCYRTRNL